MKAFLPLMLLTAILSTPSGLIGQTLAGDWSGSLQADGTTLPVVLHLRVDAGGALQATLDSPSQGAYALPGANAALQGTDFHFEIPDVKGKYSGTVGADGKTITGVWTQGSPLPLVLKQTASAAEIAQEKPSPIEGDWTGVLHTGGPSLRLAFHFHAAPHGGIDATLDSIDQGAMGIPCANAKLDGQKLMLDVPAVPGSYEATLSGDGGKLTGTWTQGKSLPLEITRDTKSASQETAPAPAAAPVPLSDLKPVLDKEFAPVIAAWPERGVVVGVLDHGRQEVFAYGSAKPDSLFEIGSITKTFTGLALAQMVTQHQITLDEPVRELLPAGIVTKPAGPEITLLDLATQHSGLPRLPDNFKPSDPGDPYSDYTARKLYELLAKRGVGRPEKTEFLYSNLGFGLLGQALAEKARMPYAKLIRTQVTGPLGLNDTAVALSTQQQSRLIQGYSGAHDAVRVWNLDAIAGAGALRSTAADLLTYAEAHLHPEKLPAANAGPVSTIAEAIRLDHQPRSDAPGGMKIALAWLIRPEQNIYWHNGGTGGYSSMLIFEPGRDRAIVILHNCEDMTPGKPQLVDRVAANITALLDGKPVPPIGD